MPNPQPEHFLHTIKSIKTMEFISVSKIEVRVQHTP